jgi:hypothetical protein
MSRPSWLKAVIGAFALCLSAAAGGAPPTPLSPDALWTRPAGAKPETQPDLTQFCAGAGTTPVCAMKTYLACALYDAPAMCAAAGLEGVPERYPGPDTLDTDVLAAPWVLPFERLMPEAFALHLYNGGFVPPDRVGAAHFDTTRGNAPPSIAGPGLYELVLDIPEPYVKGLVYRLSAFFRQTDGRWRMVGWSSSRAKACDNAAGTSAWALCRWFLKDLKQRDVFAPDVTQVWTSPRPPGRDDYPHPGLELMMGLPNQPVVAPFAGTIVRRALKYPDVPLYDWVVIEGRDRQANMTAKLAMVDRAGPAPGTAIDAAAPLGRPQWVEGEHPGAGRFIHIELLRNGQQIDPRTVMRERKQDPQALERPN